MLMTLPPRLTLAHPLPTLCLPVSGTSQSLYTILLPAFRSLPPAPYTYSASVICLAVIAGVLPLTASACGDGSSYRLQGRVRSGYVAPRCPPCRKKTFLSYAKWKTLSEISRARSPGIKSNLIRFSITNWQQDAQVGCVCVLSDCMCVLICVCVSACAF